jgi:hypothetical protein
MVLRGQRVAQQGDPIGEASIEESRMHSAHDSLGRLFQA